MEYRYHIIKESNIELEILPEIKDLLKAQTGLIGFEGSTHNELRVFGQQNHINKGFSSSFGYDKTKDGASYWVLPYPYNEALDVERKEGAEIISQTLTVEELENFGFDVEEIEFI